MAKPRLRGRLLPSLFAIAKRRAPGSPEREAALGLYPIFTLEKTATKCDRKLAGIDKDLVVELYCEVTIGYYPRRRWPWSSSPSHSPARYEDSCLAQLLDFFGCQVVSYITPKAAGGPWGGSSGEGGLTRESRGGGRSSRHWSRHWNETHCNENCAGLAQIARLGPTL